MASKCKLKVCRSSEKNREFYFDRIDTKMGLPTNYLNSTARNTWQWEKVLVTSQCPVNLTS